MDAKQISKVRMSVSRAQNTGARVRYSPFVRRAVEDWLRAGESAERVAEQSGVRLQTISRWSEQMAPGFQRVEIKSQTPPAQILILRLENGVRIATPTPELMIEMLKVLK